jgi:hypothetical protein
MMRVSRCLLLLVGCLALLQQSRAQDHDFPEDDDGVARGCMGCCIQLQESRTFSSNAPTSYNPHPAPLMLYHTCAQLVQQYMDCLKDSCYTVNYATLCPYKDRASLAAAHESVGRVAIPSNAVSPNERIWKQPVESHVSKGSFLPHYFFNGPLAVAFPPADSHAERGSPVPPCGHVDPAGRKCWRDYMDCVHGVTKIDSGQRDEGWMPPTFYSCAQCMDRFDSCVATTSPCSGGGGNQVEVDVGLDARQMLNVKTGKLEVPEAGAEPVTRDAVERIMQQEEAARTGALQHAHDEL